MVVVTKNCKRKKKKFAHPTKKKILYSLGAPRPTPANCGLYSQVRTSDLICIWEVAGKFQSWFRAISPSEQKYIWKESEDRPPMVLMKSSKTPATSKSVVLPITKQCHVILGSQVVARLTRRWPSIAWYEGACSTVFEYLRWTWASDRNQDSFIPG